MNKILKLLKEPLLHFFVLGLVVFGLHAVFEEKPQPTDDPFLVEVTSADIEWFRTMWVKRMGRQPTVEELRGQVNQLIREQVLSREAISMGLDDGDTVLRRRLTQKMDFLLKDLSQIAEPSEEELQNFFRDSRSRYEIPGNVTFTHIYFNTDKRGEEQAAAAARQLAKKLNTDQTLPAGVVGLGDPSLILPVHTDKTLVDIGSQFGPAFADGLQELKTKTWYGPVPSGYGYHAVYIQHRTAPKLPALEDIRAKVKSDWMAQKERELSRKAYDEMRKRYRVLLEGLPYDADMSG